MVFTTKVTKGIRAMKEKIRRGGGGGGEGGLDIRIEEVTH